MKTIWWIASYPKSGNTWLRALLTNYLNNAAASINHLMGGGVTSRNAFDEWLGLESSDLHVDEIEHYRHYYHLDIGKDSEMPLFIKTHDAYIKTGEGKLLLPEEVTGGVIYLIRNPLDIAISYAHHENVCIDEIIQSMNDRDKFLLSHEKRLRRSLPQRLLSWSLHVKSWLNCKKLMIVKYEDLSDDPIKTFKEILAHLRIQPVERQVKTAVENASFNKLKRQEELYGFAERHAPAKSFFRSGRVGEWKERLTQRQIDGIVSHHGEMMRYFNYL